MLLFLSRQLREFSQNQLQTLVRSEQIVVLTAPSFHQHYPKHENIFSVDEPYLQNKKGILEKYISFAIY